MTSAGDVSSSTKSAQTLKCLDFSHDADVSNDSSQTSCNVLYLRGCTLERTVAQSTSPQRPPCRISTPVILSVSQPAAVVLIAFHPARPVRSRAILPIATAEQGLRNTRMCIRTSAFTSSPHSFRVLCDNAVSNASQTTMSQFAPLSRYTAI